jgi:hypothetical protein
MVPKREEKDLNTCYFQLNYIRKCGECDYMGNFSDKEFIEPNKYQQPPPNPKPPEPIPEPKPIPVPDSLN